MWSKKQVWNLDLKKIDEINCLSDEIKHNGLMSEKYNKTCKYVYIMLNTCLF